MTDRSSSGTSEIRQAMRLPRARGASARRPALQTRKSVFARAFRGHDGPRPESEQQLIEQREVGLVPSREAVAPIRPRTFTPEMRTRATSLLRRPGPWIVARSSRAAGERISFREWDGPPRT